MPDQIGVQGHRMGKKTFIKPGAAALCLALACASAAPASAQSWSDRFKGLFGGGKKDDPPPVIVGEPKPELNCPQVTIRFGASTYAVIATKAYTTTVSMSQDESVPFTFVAEDLVYPAPVGRAGDNYIFYVGFDPQLVSAEKPKAVKKKK